jgi:hypothetical protein
MEECARFAEALYNTYAAGGFTLAEKFMIKLLLFLGGCS